MLQPWVDVGSAGSLTLSFLEDRFDAKPLGRLARPGNFFDFTRYRPVIKLVEGRREVIVPNTVVNYAMRPEENDLVFFHFLEPHMLGEAYVDSVLKIMRKLGVKRYCLLGGMYDAVPHTRPLAVTGTAAWSAGDAARRLGVRPSDYEGPTTILTRITQEAAEYGIEVATLIVHLPQYTQMEEDYAGQVRLLEVLRSLYGFSIDLSQMKRSAEEQYAKLNMVVERDPQMKDVVRQLERYYESRADKAEEPAAGLSPEIEKFLREIDRRFDGS